MSSESLLETLFPGLKNNSYHIISEAADHYNCIAHSAGKNDLWWQPEPHSTKQTYWPPGVAREWNLEALVAVFGTMGYLPCDSSALESGFEKIALYANAAAEPTHAARQLPSGA